MSLTGVRIITRELLRWKNSMEMFKMPEKIQAKMRYENRLFLISFDFFLISIFQDFFYFFLFISFEIFFWKFKTFSHFFTNIF